jgi:hypothetical protein
MSDALSFAELEEQHVELLPPRTVLSMISFSSKPPRNDGSAGSAGSAQQGISVKILSGFCIIPPANGCTSSATGGGAIAGGGGAAGHG